MAFEISMVESLFAAPTNYMGMGSMAVSVVLALAVVLVAVYIYTAFALMTIAKKTKTKDPWMAWIPILNLYLMTKIAKVPAWTILVLLLVFIPLLGIIVSVGITIYWWMKIAERVKKPSWMGILMAIPGLNLVIIGILAWSD